MTITVNAVEKRFIRGDFNADGSVHLVDAISLLAYLFGCSEDPLCLDDADANDDGAITLCDPIAVLSHLFGMRHQIPEPNPGCGLDPTEDGLGCDAYPVCQ